MAKNDAVSDDEEIRDEATVAPDAEDATASPDVEDGHVDAGGDGEHTLTRGAGDGEHGDGSHGDGFSEDHADGGASQATHEPSEAMDLVSKAKGSIDGLFSHLRRGWEEYTEDVRQPEPAVGSEPAAVEHAALATVVRPAATADEGAKQAAAPTNAAAASPAVQLPHPANVARGAASVVKSFVDGVLGRPQPPAAVMTGGSKRSSLKTALKIVTGIFAVLGVLAVFRASMDAFRPRR